MQMTGQQTIAAPRQRVWEALNDPEVLKQCIPGCQEIDKTSDTSFDARVKAKVGPVNSTFSGSVELSNLNPPESYTIAGKGSGGAAGFAKGSAEVSLEDQGEQTVLRYTVDAQVGGKLAQVGNRLVKSTADKYAKQFFETFNEVVSGAAASDATEAGEAATVSAAQTSETPAAASVSSAGASEPAASAETAATASAGAQTEAGTADSGSTAQTAAAPREPEPAAAGHPDSAEAGGRTHEAGTGERGQPPAPRRGLRPRVWIAIVILIALGILVVATV